jgi:hypothetical protein
MDERPGRSAGVAGGTLGPRWIESLGVAASVGVDPYLIATADPLLRDLLIDVAESAVRATERRDDALAVRIINTLADALKRKH